MKLYCINDKLAKKVSPPTPCENDDVAKRMFKMTMSKTPVELLGDYELLRVGFFDDVTGALSSVSTEPVVILDGSETLEDKK